MIPLSDPVGVTRRTGMLTTLTPERFADLLLLRPPKDARAAALGLINRGVPAREIYLGLLAPALREVGWRWQRGLATVAQEHLATTVVGSIMTELVARLAETSPVRCRAVLACTSGELHEVGLRMIGDFLGADGWEVFYVGASTPGTDLAQLVDRVQPDVVGLSTTMEAHLPQAAVAVAAVRARAASPFVIVGGAAFGGQAEIARDLGADGFAADAGAASTRLHREFGTGGGRGRA